MKNEHIYDLVALHRELARLYPESQNDIETIRKTHYLKWVSHSKEFLEKAILDSEIESNYDVIFRQNAIQNYLYRYHQQYFRQLI